jgi:WD40 repeat protein
MVLCLFCHKEGHTVPDCGKLKRNVCSLCGEKGHTPKFCRTKTRPTPCSVPVPPKPLNGVYYNIILFCAMSKLRYNLKSSYRRTNYLPFTKDPIQGIYDVTLPPVHLPWLRMANAFLFFLANRLTQYDGKYGNNARAFVCLMNRPRFLPKLPHGSVMKDTAREITCVATDCESNVIALGTSTGKVFLKNEWLMISLQNSHDGWVRALAFCCSNVIASGADDCTIRLSSYNTRLTVNNCLPLAVLNGHDSEVWSLAFSQNCLVSGCNQNCLKVWDLTSVSCSQTINFPPSNQQEPNCLLVMKFSQEGDKVAVGCSDCSITILKVCDGNLALESRLPDIHTSKITCLQWLSSTTIVSSGWDGRINIVDIKDVIRLASFQASRLRIWVLELINPNCFMTAGNDGQIDMWQLELEEGHVSTAVLKRKRNTLYVSGAVSCDNVYMVSTDQKLETIPFQEKPMIRKVLQPPEPYVHPGHSTLIKCGDTYEIKVSEKEQR